MGNISSFFNKLLSPFGKNDFQEDKPTIWRAENTQSKRTIGSSPFGMVIEASNIKNGQSCAIKTIEYEKKSDWVFEYAQKKAKLLIEISNLKHPNILKTFVCERIEVENSFNLKSKYAFIMELYDENLASIITERKRIQEFFEEFYLLKELLQLVGALSEAYKLGFHHYSIKVENIFMNKEGQRLILGDFDTFENSILKNNPRNVDYQPPEVSNSITNLLNKDGNGTPDYSKGDIYSLGVVFVKLALLEESFSLEKLENLKNKKEYTRLYEIIKQMLLQDHETRPSLSELFKIIQEQIIEIKGIEYYEKEFVPIYLENGQKVTKSLLENGGMYRQAEDYKQGISQYQRCIDDLVNLVSKKQYDQYLLSLAYDGISSCYLGMKDFQQAMRYILKSLKIRNTYLKSFKVQENLMSMGKVYQKLADFQNALIYYMRCYESCGTNKVDPLVKVKCEENIGYCYENLGDSENAIANYVNALKTIQQNFGETNVKYANNLKAIARVFKKIGNQEKSKLFENRVRELRYRD